MAAVGGSREQGSAPSSRRRGRRRGVEVRPGSVKQARAEAGLSLGQVAQGDISRTAIYFVETGKAKPSMETLQLIATRTNKPVDFFLAGSDTAAHEEAALARLERLVAVGDHDGAIQAAEELLARPVSAATAAHARFFMAMALIRSFRPARGRAQVSAARAFFERAGDVLMAAETMGWEAGAAFTMQDPAALGLIEEALARCRSIQPVPAVTEARLLSILGHVRVARHEYTAAIKAYEQAAAVGAAFPDLRRLSYVYTNLCFAYQETGDFVRAAQYARRAMALQETLHDTHSIAISENNLGMVLYRQGDLAGAFKHAERSLQLFAETGLETGKAPVLMTLAELELARGGTEAAERWAREAVGAAERTGEATNAGEAHVWLGRVADARGDRATCDAEFEVAFARFEEADAEEWQTRNRIVYAEILERRGDLAAANYQLHIALDSVGVRPTVLDTARIAIA